MIDILSGSDAVFNIPAVIATRDVTNLFNPLFPAGATLTVTAFYDGTVQINTTTVYAPGGTLADVTALFRPDQDPTIDAATGPAPTADTINVIAAALYPTVATTLMGALNDRFHKRS